MLTLVLPIFTIIYFFALIGWMGPPETICVFQLLSVATKGFFAYFVLGSHLGMVDPATRALIEEKRANEARRQFLRYIFHEVRTPLNSLTMGIDILERSDNLDEFELESLLMMRDASTFMSETLNDVLSMQKIEEGKLELELAPFSIRECVSKVYSTFRGSLITKDVTFKRLISDNVPTQMYGDRFRIEHLLANLLSNAIKFSPKHGNITVSVTAESIPGEPDMVRVTVSVTDEGPGISEEDQKKLFSSFMQIKVNELQQGQGSGVGLALCKQIVMLHGGTIGVKSSAGAGSTFFFSIPFKLLEKQTGAAVDDFMVNFENVYPETASEEKSGHIALNIASLGARENKTTEVKSCELENKPVEPRVKTSPHDERVLLRKEVGRVLVVDGK